MAQRLVAALDLRALLHDSFAGAGLREGDAAAVADVLVDANLRGVESHGLARAPVYLRRVRDAVATGTDGLTVAVDAGALCRLEAGGGIGPAVGVAATDLAVERAVAHGVGVVAVGGSGHFGAAGYYARRAAGRGLVALVTSNGPPSMAPHGAAEPFLGTNAVAVAAPLGRHGTFCLDMSSSTVARGRILRAAALGEAIEPGWAVDADGRPTTDPAAALAGAVLPLGGAKGSGLAFAVCLLAGTLAGAPFDPDVVPTVGPRAGDRQDLGQIFVVLDPWRLASREEAAARVEALVDRLHDLRAAEGFDGGRVAGERGDALARHRAVHGVPVEAAELDELAQACAACGLPELAGRAAGLGA